MSQLLYDCMDYSRVLYHWHDVLVMNAANHLVCYIMQQRPFHRHHRQEGSILNKTFFHHSLRIIVLSWCLPEGWSPDYHKIWYCEIRVLTAHLLELNICEQLLPPRIPCKVYQAQGSDPSFILTVRNIQTRSLASILIVRNTQTSSLLLRQSLKKGAV